MSQSPYPFRQIILEEAARQEVDHAIESIARFEDAFAGLEWLLSRDPTVGQRLNKTIFGFEAYIYVADSNHYAATPMIGVIYTYDTDTVTIYGVNIVPYSPHNP